MTLEGNNTDKILSIVSGTVCVYYILAIDTRKEEGKGIQVVIVI